MVYLANALINPKVTIEVYEKLQDIGVEAYLPNSNIKFEGREININAFEQLRKRNPTNPHLIELKELIIKELIGHMVLSDLVLVCNSSNETLNNQTIFEISIAWFLKKPIYSYNIFPLDNRELLSALGVIHLKENIDIELSKTIFNFKKEKEIKEEEKSIEEKVSKKQKLTIKEG